MSRYIIGLARDEEKMFFQKKSLSCLTFIAIYDE